MIHRIFLISALLLVFSFIPIKAGVAKFDGAGVYFLGGGSWSLHNDDFVYFPNSTDTIRSVPSGGRFLFSSEAYLGFSFFYLLAIEFGLNVDVVNPNVSLQRISHYNQYVTKVRMDSLGVMSYKSFFTRFVLKVPVLDRFFRPFYSFQFGRYKEFLGLFTPDEARLQWKINWVSGAYFFPDFPLGFRLDLKHYNYTYTMYKNTDGDLNTRVSTFAIAGTIIIQKVATK